MVLIRIHRLRVPAVVLNVRRPPQAVVVVLIRHDRGLGAEVVALLAVRRELRVVAGEEGPVHRVVRLRAPHVGGVFGSALPDFVFVVEEEDVEFYCRLNGSTSSAKGTTTVRKWSVESYMDPIPQGVCSQWGAGLNLRPCSIPGVER